MSQRRKRGFMDSPMMAREPKIRVRSELLRQKVWAPLRRPRVALALAAGIVLLAGVGGLKLIETGGSFAITSAIPAERGHSEPRGKGARVVHFPVGRSLGRLLVKDAGIDDSLDPFGDVVFRWEYFAEATGDVTVPPGKRFGLWVHPAALSDLSPLSALKPDDLHMLMISPLPTPRLNPDEAIMPYLSGLTGLETLVLEYMNITQKGLGFIKGLKSLKHLRLSSEPPTKSGAVPKDFGNAGGIACLAELRSLETLWLSSPRITDDCLSYVAKLKSLRELQVWSPSIRGPGLAYLAKLPSLERLRLQLRVGDAGLVHLKNIATLRELRLGAFGITDAGLSHLANLAGLEHLDLSQNPITGTGLAAVGALRSLNELNLSGTKITDDALAHVRTMRSLTSLDLTYTQITDSGLAHLKEMRSLESLKLPAGITDSGLAYLGGLDKLKRLWNPGPVTDAGLQHLAKLQSLEELRVRGEAITDAGMPHIAKLTNLRALSITCPITNGGLATLTALKSLTTLRLQRTAITMSGLAQLNALTGLTHLELYNVPSDGSPLNIGGLTQLKLLDFGKTRLDDEDLACLAKLTRLKELYFLPQSGISDRGIAHLSGLVLLEHLGIGGPHLTDKSLSYLANMKKLDYLWVGDGDFTDEGLRHLEGLKGLRSLEVTSRSAFSPGALDRPRKNLPNLQSWRIVP